MKDEICPVDLKQKDGAGIRVAIGPISLNPLSPESIEWLIEDQAFSPSSLSPFLVGKVDWRHKEDWERETTCWREKGWEAKSYDVE